MRTLRRRLAVKLPYSYAPAGSVLRTPSSVLHTASSPLGGVHLILQGRFLRWGRILVSGPTLDWPTVHRAPVAPPRFLVTISIHSALLLTCVRGRTFTGHPRG